MTLIRTVLGDVDGAALGVVNYHEHLFQVSPLLPGDELDDEAKSRVEAELLVESGTNSMIDATPIGLGRRPEDLARISAETGLGIVATTGVHREAHYGAGHWLRALSVAELSSRFTADLLHGMAAVDAPPGESTPGSVGAVVGTAAAAAYGGEPIRAGVLKAGIGYWSITHFERTVLDAVSRSQLDSVGWAGAAVEAGMELSGAELSGAGQWSPVPSGPVLSGNAAPGAPVMIHLEFGTAAHEVLDVLESNGVPASRVVLAHADRNPDIGLHLELASRGAYLGYDGMARPKGQTDAEIIALTAGVVAGGGGDRILLGGDVARRTRYVGYGGMPGLAYLMARFVPRVRDTIGEAALTKILVANPVAALSWL